MRTTPNTTATRHFRYIVPYPYGAHRHHGPALILFDFLPYGPFSWPTDHEASTRFFWFRRAKTLLPLPLPSLEG